MNKKTKTNELVLLGLLAAVLIVMSCTPLGFLNIGPLAITLNIIPVAIAAVAIGGIAGYSEAPFGSCTSSASISLSAKYGSGVAPLGKISASASNLGGIVGAAWSGFSAADCSNEGEISYVNDSIEAAGNVRGCKVSHSSFIYRI